MSLLTTLFPVPSFFALPAVGIDFSDAVMRYVELAPITEGIAPKRFGEVPIPAGCMQGGRVVDEVAFTEFLRTVKREHNLEFVRVAIPESQVYLFTLSIDAAAGNDIRAAIELVIEDNIPIRASETIFDFSILKTSGTAIIVAVVAVSEATATTLHTCFVNAEMKPLSFELDAQAIARAVLPITARGCRMIVDIGAHRTGIIITAEGSVVYTATIEFGGDMLTQTLSTKLGIGPAEAEALKKTIGLSHSPEHASFFEALSSSIVPLKDEINHRYLYWQEKKEQLGGFPSIETIYICGGHSNLSGLNDYLSAALKLPVMQANSWVNCFAFEAYVPEMPFETSMSYVTAVGLALADHIS
ncbi:MAG: pilus assembly protein PilM [Minisyncoccia bacterium]